MGLNQASMASATFSAGTQYRPAWILSANWVRYMSLTGIGKSLREVDTFGSMPKRILIVEDEEAVRELEKFILEERGYEVMEARDGLEGLAKAEFRKPDLILLDLMMPDVSGGRMFDEMRQHPLTADIPIVVVTGKPDAHQMFDEEIGSDDVIMKPFEAETLLTRIRYHIGDPE
jgi:CheY-like chemotaxis protein